MGEYFPEQKSLAGRVNVELDLSNYARKTDLKIATGKIAKYIHPNLLNTLIYLI